MKVSVEKAKDFFLLWAQSNKYEENLSIAEEVIIDAIKEYKKSYLAFSGGKDSHVMLDMIYNIHSGVDVYHRLQGEYMPSKIQKEIDDIIRSYNPDKIIHKTRNDHITRDIIPWFKDNGYDCAFVGCRNEESISRKIRNKKGISIGEIEEVWPLAHWKWMDVWAYIFKNKLKYISTYDLYCPVMGWDKARFHNFFAETTNTGMKFGTSNIDKMLMWRHMNKRS